MRRLLALLLLLAPIQARAALHLATSSDFFQAPVATAFNIGNAATGNYPTQVSVTATASAAAGQAVIPVSSVSIPTGIVASSFFTGMYVPASAYYPATTVLSVSGLNVTLATNITTAIPSGTALTFGGNHPGWGMCEIFQSTAQSASSNPVLFGNASSLSKAANTMAVFASASGASATIEANAYSSGPTNIATGNVSDYSVNMLDNQWRMVCIQEEQETQFDGTGGQQSGVLRVYTGYVGGGSRLSGGFRNEQTPSAYTPTVGMEFGGLPGTTTFNLVGSIYRAWGYQGNWSKAAFDAVLGGTSPTAEQSALGLPALNWFYDASLGANGNPTVGSTASGTVADQSGNGNAATISGAPTWAADPVFASPSIGIDEPPVVWPVHANGASSQVLTGPYSSPAPTNVDAQVEYAGVTGRTLGVTPSGSSFISVNATAGIVPGMNIFYLGAVNPAAAYPLITSVVAPVAITQSGAAIGATSMTVSSCTGIGANQQFFVGSNYYTVTSCTGTTMSFGLDGSPTTGITGTALSAGSLTVYGLLNLNTPLTGATVNANNFPVAGGKNQSFDLTTATAAGGNVLQLPASTNVSVGQAVYLPGFVPAGAYVSAINGSSNQATLSYWNGSAVANANLLAATTVGQRVDFGGAQVVQAWTTLTTAAIASGRWQATLANTPMGVPYVVRVRNTAVPTETGLTQQTVGVGYVVLDLGQSLMYNLGGEGPFPGQTAPTLTAQWTYLASQETGYCNGGNVSGYTGSAPGTIALANMMGAAIPWIPVQIIHDAVGGVGMVDGGAQFTLAGSTNVAGSSVLTLSAAGTTNAFGSLVTAQSNLYVEAQTGVPFGTAVTTTAAASGSNYTVNLSQPLTGPPGSTVTITNFHYLDFNQPNGLYQNSISDVQRCGGDVNAIAWDQGQSDAGYGVSTAAYEAGLFQLAGEYQSAFGRTAKQLPFLVGVNGPDYGLSDSVTNAVRTAQVAYANYFSPSRMLNNQELAHPIGQLQVHTVSGTFTQFQGASMAQSILAALVPSLAIPPAIGPVFTRAEGAANVVRLYARMVGGTALGVVDPLDPPGPFTVTDSAGSLTVTGYVNTPSSIDLILNRAAQGPLTVGFAQTTTLGNLTVLSANPFTTTAGNTTLTLNWPAHGLHAGDHFNLSSSSNSPVFGGLPTATAVYVQNEFTVASVLDANDITFVVNAAFTPTAGGSNGGTGWQVRPMPFVTDNSVLAFGQTNPVGLGQPPQPVALALTTLPQRLVRRR